MKTKPKDEDGNDCWVCPDCGQLNPVSLLLCDSTECLSDTEQEAEDNSQFGVGA